MKLPRIFHDKLAAAAEACVWHPPMRPCMASVRAGVCFCPPCRTFATFWTDTSHIWRGIASNLIRKWKPPVGSCSVDDVYTDLGMAVSSLLRAGKYDSHNVGGRSLADYVVFNACNKAKYKLHKLRGANLHGNHDSNPSRAPKSFTEVGIGVPGHPRENYGERAIPIRQDALVGWHARVEPNQADRLFGQEQLLAMLDECENLRERFGLVALFMCEGDVDEATRTVYGNLDIRGLCHLGSETQARAAVRRAARLYLEWRSAEMGVEQEVETTLGRELTEEALAENLIVQEASFVPDFSGFDDEPEVPVYDFWFDAEA